MTNIQGVGLRGVGFGLASGVARTKGIARETNATLAYSLRDVGALGDPVIRVRRDNDNSEQDFSATEVSNGTLEAFVGAGNNGFVRTWYNQTSGGIDLEQSTTGIQPKIVNNGTLLSDGIDFMGSSFLFCTSQGSVFPIPQPLTVFMVSKLDSASSFFDGYFSDISDFAATVFYADTASSAALTADGTNTNISKGSINLNEAYYTILANGANSEIRENGTSVAAGNISTGGIPIRLCVGGIVGTFNLNGHISELTLFASNASSLTQKFESNMASYYGI
jgi:hypothetical protein